MGGGVVMKVVGMIAGFRSGFPASPEKITSAEFKANTARPITGVISDTQYDAASSTVNKPLIEFEDWEVATEVESSVDVGQPLPRLVFGGAPTLEEAQDATFQLTTALDQAYLSNESSESSCESDMGHAKLALSDSGCLESKTCVTKASAPNQAFQAYQLLKRSAAVQTLVTSIASDQKVWDAVTENEAFLEFFQSQKTGVNGSLEEDDEKEPTANTEIPGYQSSNYSDDEKEPTANTEIPGCQSSNYSDDEKEPKNGFNSLFKDIKSRVEDMMNSLPSFFPKLFAGPAAAGFPGPAAAGFPGPAAGGGSAKVEIGTSIMGLALMVIMVVVFKRV